jgi:uncharacterized LabA/DUF88 family protein
MHAPDLLLAWAILHAEGEFGLIRHPDRMYHEKGVDVRLAVEMIRLAREDRYDQAYLVSSATDPVPAVEEVQRLGKAAQYVGTPKGQSYGLSKIADDVRLLRPEDVAPSDRL